MKIGARKLIEIVSSIIENGETEDFIASANENGIVLELDDDTSIFMSNFLNEKDDAMPSIKGIAPGATGPRRCKNPQNCT